MNRWRWWKWIKKKGKRSGSEKEYKIKKIMSRGENNEEREQCVDLGNTKKRNDGMMNCVEEKWWWWNNGARRDDTCHMMLQWC